MAQKIFRAVHYTTMQRQYTENSKQIFPEMKLRGLVPNSYIHVSVRDLYIHTIGLSIVLQENRWTSRDINSSQIHLCGNWD